MAVQCRNGKFNACSNRAKLNAGKKCHPSKFWWGAWADCVKLKRNLSWWYNSICTSAKLIANRCTTCSIWANSVAILFRCERLPGTLKYKSRTLTHVPRCFTIGRIVAWFTSLPLTLSCCPIRCHCDYWLMSDAISPQCWLVPRRESLNYEYQPTRWH